MTARGTQLVLAAAVVTLALTGCVPEPATDAVPSTSPPDVTFFAVIDGDTIDTSAGKVRIIGIDAPERGQCGYDDASALLSSLLEPGDPLALELPDGQNDEDGYGRMLRYVDTAQGIDVAAALLAEGLAVARYDSTDGYPAHPRESGYHAAQVATLTADGVVMTPACQTAAETPIVVEREPAPTLASTGDEWWRQYTSCTKLKKNTMGHPIGPFSRDDPDEAAIYEWFVHGTGHDGDGDRDGQACE